MVLINLLVSWSEGKKEGRKEGRNGREGGRKERNEVKRKERRGGGVCMYVVVCVIVKRTDGLWSMFFFKMLF